MPNAMKINFNISEYSIIHTILKSNTETYETINMNVKAVRSEVITVDKTKKCFVKKSNKATIYSPVPCCTNLAIIYYGTEGDLRKRAAYNLNSLWRA
jgi:hypothetical protein